MSSKLTSEEVELKAELEGLVERINLKIRNITWTYQKLPYERLAKGRRLKERCLVGISYLEAGKIEQVKNVIRELELAGIPINTNPWKTTLGS